LKETIQGKATVDILWKEWTKFEEKLTKVGSSFRELTKVDEIR